MLSWEFDQGLPTATHPKSRLQNPNDTCHRCTKACEVLKILENEGRRLLVLIASKNGDDGGDESNDIEYQQAFRNLVQNLGTPQIDECCNQGKQVCY
jgi:hypothetical protein